MLPEGVTACWTACAWICIRSVITPPEGLHLPLHTHLSCDFLACDFVRGTRLQISVVTLALGNCHLHFTTNPDLTLKFPSREMYVGAALSTHYFTIRTSRALAQL